MDKSFKDFTKTVSPDEQQRVRDAQQKFSRKFPQSKVVVVIRSFDPDHSLASQLFWLFNAGGIFAGSKTYGENRDILLGIDPSGRRAGLMIGYGLDVFLGEDSLDAILHKAAPLLEKDHFARAASLVIDELSDLLQELSQAVSHAFNLSGDDSSSGEVDY